MAAAKPNYDSRATKARNLIAELLRMGLVPPISVELDGLRIEVAAYSDPSPPTVGNPGVLAQSEMAAQAQAQQVRSYRQRAREELRQRIRESDGGEA